MKVFPVKVNATNIVVLTTTHLSVGKLGDAVRICKVSITDPATVDFE